MRIRALALALSCLPLVSHQPGADPSATADDPKCEEARKQELNALAQLYLKYLLKEQPDEFMALSDPSLNKLSCLDQKNTKDNRDSILKESIKATGSKATESKAAEPKAAEPTKLPAGHLHNLSSDQAKALYHLALKAEGQQRKDRHKEITDAEKKLAKAKLDSEQALLEFQQRKASQADLKESQEKLEKAAGEVVTAQRCLAEEQASYTLEHPGEDESSDARINKIMSRLSNLEHSDLLSNLNVTFFVGSQFFATYGEKADPAAVATGGVPASFLAGPNKLISAEFQQGIVHRDFYGISPLDLFSRVSFGSKDGSTLKGSNGFSGELGFSGVFPGMRFSKALVRLFASYGMASLPDKSDNLGVDTRFVRTFTDPKDLSKGFTYSDAPGNRRFADHLRAGLTLVQFNQSAWNQSFLDLAYERDHYYLEPGRIALKGRLYFAKDLAFVQLDLSRALHRGNFAVDSLALTLGIPFQADRVGEQLKALFGSPAK